MTQIKELSNLYMKMFHYYRYMDDYQTFIDILKKRKPNPIISLYIGWCYLEQAKNELGKKYLYNAIEDSNHKKEIIAKAAYICLDNKLYNEAEQYSKMLINSTKFIGEGYCNLTRLYIETGKMKEADAVWEKFNKLIDDSSQEMQTLYINNKIEFFKINKKFVNNNAKEIIKCYETLSNSVNKHLNLDSYQYIIDSYIELGEVKLAIDVCNIILDMEVPHIWYKNNALRLKGDCYFILKKYNNAIQCYNDMDINLDEQKMLYISKCYEQLGDSEMTIKCAKEYIKLAKKEIRKRKCRKYEMFIGVEESFIKDAKQIIKRCSTGK